jgi:hypothetical protein
VVPAAHTVRVVAMITVSSDVRAILGGSFVYTVQAQSWLGDQLLADDVPIADATETSDRSLKVPERVTLSIPKMANGVNWTPAFADSPLAANGQVLKISLGVGKGTDGVEWFQRGEFLIEEADEQDETIEVTCVGLLALIDEAQFIAPYQPTANISDTVRDLLEPAVSVNLDQAPTDRAVPVSAVNFDSDRLQALYDVLDAWPAIPFMDEQGFLEILPDTVPTVADAVRSFTDQAGGTVITATGSSSRDGGFNVVVATGYASDGTELRAVAYLGTGPWAYGSGTANPLPVPFGYSSPLMTTYAQVQAAAATVLRRKAREAALQSFTITAVPDPTIQLGDPVLITNDFVTGLLCTVETITLPYLPGQMTLKVVSVS